MEERKEENKPNRTGIDLENINVFPASEIPARTRTTTPWQAIFKKIRKGRAIAIKDSAVAAVTVVQALRREHKKGNFKNLRATKRGTGEKAIIYVINDAVNMKYAQKGE